nr:transposase [Roseovarius carneus]
MEQRMARRTKRLWTDEEKRSICFQTTAAGVSVAQFARRYAMNANMIFKWLRDPRYAPDPTLDLSRFDAAPLIAFIATKETDYRTETDGRIPPGCGAYRTDQRANA